MVAFHLTKRGNAAWEQDDAFGYDEFPRHGTSRCIVVDGATEAYDTARWTRQLVRSFVRATPALTPMGMMHWIEEMQELWEKQTPEFANYFEERKFHEYGSFATVLCCQIHFGSDGAWWQAAALGDTVLFHVRRQHLIETFPDLRSEDFGSLPEGAFTLRSQRSRMFDALRFSSGSLRDGDALFVATDALANRIIRGCENGEDAPLWPWLEQLRSPQEFIHEIDRLRDVDDIANDDVTLLRVLCTSVPPRFEGSAQQPETPGVGSR